MSYVYILTYEWTLIINSMSYDNEFTRICAHDPLTHWGRVTHICVSNLTIIGLDNGLSPARRQAIILTNYNNFYWTPRNKLQWIFNPNCNILIQENAFESVVWEMASILSRPRCLMKASYSDLALQSPQGVTLHTLGDMIFMFLVKVISFVFVTVGRTTMCMTMFNSYYPMINHRIISCHLTA